MEKAPIVICASITSYRNEILTSNLCHVVEGSILKLSIAGRRTASYACHNILRNINFLNIYS